MISAQEARDLSTAICKQAERDLEDLNEEIKKAASNGLRSFWHDGYVHKQAMKVLKDLGYELHESDSQIDGYSLQVKW